MRPLGVGVVGLGVISRFYRAALRRTPGMRLVAVCDRDERVLRVHRGELACYLDHRDLLADERVDAVVVTVPNDAHAAVCADAIAAGRPVCVEKPLATTVAAGQELAAAAVAAGVPLFTAFHRRYNAGVRALVAALRNTPPVTGLTVRYWERIEDHVGADRWYLDPARCGGGCVADNGPNAFDVAALVAGDLAVTGVRIERDGAGVDRRAWLDLCAASGAAVRVELDWSFPGERKDIEVTLADGSTRRADMLRGYRGFKASLWHEYVGVLAEFATVLGGGVDAGAAAGPGLAALRLVDACYRAERSAAPVSAAAPAPGD